MSQKNVASTKILLVHAKEKTALNLPLFSPRYPLKRLATKMTCSLNFIEDWCEIPGDVKLKGRLSLFLYLISRTICTQSTSKLDKLLKILSS